MTLTPEQLTELLEKHPRIVDLLRYCRHQLLDEKLITQDEFTSLLAVDGAVARLETYDKMQARIEELPEEVERLTKVLSVIHVGIETSLRNAQDESKPAAYRLMMEHFAEAGRQIIEETQTNDHY